MDKYNGNLAAAGAYVIWGFLPVYWKVLANVPAYEIMCHRMVWSLVFTLGLIIVLGRWQSMMRLVRNFRSAVGVAFAAILLSCNWLLYIWAVNAGAVVEASLGYFINPLISVLFGVVFLRERLRLMQCISLFTALAGVLYLTYYYGEFPWIALSLAATFAVYGLLHKKTSLPALEGLSLETLVLSVPAALFLAYGEIDGSGSFLSSGPMVSLLLFGTGLVTSVPLLLFGYAARKISLTLLGLLQYIAPTINLLLGILVFSEPFPPARMAGFVIIWSALFLYMAEGMYLKVRQKKILAGS
ncbi:EamA family transporter RarD [Desulforhopalus singaporensis]|uniref:Chloramphenicol-sensitive protein RarD n=1 Tax=Desulforhopalus singaporensis TaxID=91360 RepID=A0A1H0T820_9BACT|nr:EamA family transporter RarD [Desulforhopalus singaporensis]SDP49840.1 chloramphenicol-sensitive protein RarD [Desulforhopalus singaporensis]